ncbi:uncharacterized protein LOC127871990 isoform X2 [Dreissena polymorpha]|uniref:F5/8 type C domain-containing protein n=1 Tax=Dreissena polymorpha TaxID=45954 RepID=A0A9D4LLJ1_DREPO|nr:uncharacterized protein LOC127871990 isoform X2 [Dreissena polymorpha]KAH3859848.1 hypothetical protein DPMN_102669 [Dreissena polymorpha]
MRTFFISCAILQLLVSAVRTGPIQIKWLKKSCNSCDKKNITDEPIIDHLERNSCEAACSQYQSTSSWVLTFYDVHMVNRIELNYDKQCCVGHGTQILVSVGVESEFIRPVDFVEDVGSNYSINLRPTMAKYLQITRLGKNGSFLCEVNAFGHYLRKDRGYEEKLKFERSINRTIVFSSPENTSYVQSQIIPNQSSESKLSQETMASTCASEDETRKPRDGDMDTCIYNQAWWRLDLGAIIVITRITILGKGDNIIVSTGRKLDTLRPEIFVDRIDGEFSTELRSSPVRYVQLHTLEYEMHIMSLCEIELHGAVDEQGHVITEPYTTKLQSSTASHDNDTTKADTTQLLLRTDDSKNTSSGIVLPVVAAVLLIGVAILLV